MYSVKSGDDPYGYRLGGSKYDGWYKLSSKLTNDRAHGIDALRGIAASGVVFVHAIHINPIGVDFYWYNVSYLALGVALFFVVSAFSMCLAYPNGIDRSNLHKYALRRFFRIAPLFYVMLIAWWFLYLNPSASQLLKNITFTYGFWEETQVSLVPAGWSIGVESIFYLLFPILIYFRGIRISIIILIFALITCYVLNTYYTSEELYFYWTNFFTNAPYFAFGIVGYALFQIAPSQYRNALGSLCLILGLSIIFAMFMYGPVLTAELSTSAPIPVGFVFGWGLGFFFLVLSQALHPIVFLVNPVTLFLGKISYALYLAHPLFIYHTKITVWAATLTDNALLVMPVVCVVTLGAMVPIAYLIHLLVESPFILLGRWMTTRSRLETEAVRSV